MSAIELKNSKAILSRVNGYLGEEPDDDRKALTQLLLQRIAAESGLAGVVSSQDLYVAVRDAERAREAGAYHYLNRLYQSLDATGKRTLAGTLMAISEAVMEPSMRAPSPLQGIHIQPRAGRDDPIAAATASEASWREFMTGLKPDMSDTLMTGARELVTRAERSWQRAWAPENELFGLNESPDMPLGKLIRRAVDIARRDLVADGNPLLEQVIEGVLEGLAAAENETVLLGKLYDRSGGFRGDVMSLFRALMESPDVEIARQAIEATIFLNYSTAHIERAGLPPGMPTPNFPVVNGEDRDEVLAFMGRLGFTPATEEQSEAFWRVWIKAWRDTRVRAGDLLADWDKTVYDYSMTGFAGEGKSAWEALEAVAQAGWRNIEDIAVTGYAREDVRLREILIMLIAKALRDKHPVPFATHSAASRVVELANHPSFGLMKFAFFLRMPEDAPLTLDELNSYPYGVTFHKLSVSEIAVLEKFRANGRNLGALTPVERSVVAMALMDVESWALDFIRGHKFPEMMAFWKEGQSFYHLDDTYENVEVTAGSGGRAVLAPKRLMPASGSFDANQSYVYNVADALSQLPDEAPGTFVELTATSQEFAGFPAGRVHYQDFIGKAVNGWLRPMVELTALKLSIWSNIVLQGQFRATRKALRAIIDERVPVRRRSELRAPTAYTEGNVLTEFTRRLQPTLTTRDLPPITDFVHVARLPDGALEITAKSYDPAKPAALDAGARFNHYAIIAKLGWRAMRLAIAGDEDGLNHLLAVWAAEVMDNFGLRLIVRGLENLGEPIPVIFAPNHASELDYILPFLPLKGYTQGYVVKGAFSWFPFFSTVIRNSARFLLINRRDPGGAMGALKLMAENMREAYNRISVTIFPEGTRSRIKNPRDINRTDGPMYRKGGLKEGVAHFAVDSGLDVVPVALNGFGRVLPAGAAPAIVNETVSMDIGNRISPGVESQERCGRITAIMDGIYAHFERYVDAPKADRSTARARLALAKLERGKTLAVDIDAVADVLKAATKLSATLGMTPKELASAVKKGKVNASRVGVNRYLDRFRQGLVLLVAGREDEFGDWCRDNFVTPQQVRALVTALSPEEIDGVFARGGHDLNAIRAGTGFTDDRITVQFMRAERTAFDLGKSVLMRALDRFIITRRPAVTGAPEVEYHDSPANVSATYEEYTAAYDREHAEDYASASELLQGQIALQSDNFAPVWTGISTDLAQITMDWNRAGRQFVTALNNAPPNDYSPVSTAWKNLYAEIATARPFAGVDEDLQIWAFETLAAGSLTPALSQGERATNAKYYRLWGQGTFYQIMNFYQTAREAGVNGRGLARIRDQAEKVKLMAELVARGVSLEEHLDKIRTCLGKLYAELGPLGVKRIKPMSATVKLYADISREERHFTQLLKMRHATPGISNDEFLMQLAEREFAITDLAREPAETLNAVIAANPQFGSALARVRQAESDWEESATRRMEATLIPRLKYYQAGFATELKTNDADHLLQKSRYEDIMRTLNETGNVTLSQEERYLQALGDYKLRYLNYRAVAGDMMRPGSQTTEPNRKKQELETFFAWLRLHWTVCDIAKENGSVLAGKIRPFSAMFPNQSRVLNSIASDRMEGLSPIFDSMTFELICELHQEVRSANDPRTLQRIMARWGMDGMRRGSTAVHVYGAGVLAGALGQGTGADLFEAGKSILDSAQVKVFGMIPRAMVFSGNHQGFADYLLFAAFMQSLGLGDIGTVSDLENFYAMLILGTQMSNAHAIFTLRDKQSKMFDILSGTDRGKTRLVDAITPYADRGISPQVFDWGTRKLTTVMNSFAGGPFAAFLPREFILAGSRAEGASAGAVARIPTVATWQDAAFNVEPDLGLTGNKWRGNVKDPWSIHNGTGELLKRPAVLSFAQPFPSWRTEGLLKGQSFDRGLGLAGMEPSHLARRANAAFTETARCEAYMQTLRPAMGLPRASLLGL